MTRARETERTSLGERLFTTNEMAILWNRFKRQRTANGAMTTQWVPTLVRLVL